MSCSYNIDPTSYSFQYPGSTFSTDERSTNIYIVPEFELEDIEIARNIRRLFPEDGSKMSADLSPEALSLGIDYLQRVERVDEFTYSTLRNQIGAYQIPKLLNITSKYEVTAYNLTLVLTNLRLSSPGVVYFLLQEDLELAANKNELIKRDLKFPTAQQILNCQNGYGNPEKNCARAVFDGETVNVTFWNSIKRTIIYRLFYTISNESPMEPIYDKTVGQISVNSFEYMAGSVNFLRSSVAGLSLLIAMLFIFFAY